MRVRNVLRIFIINFIVIFCTSRTFCYQNLLTLITEMFKYVCLCSEYIEKVAIHITTSIFKLCGEKKRQEFLYIFIQK